MLSKLGISVFGKGTINTLHMRCFSAGLQESFEAAQKKVGTLQEDPGNEIKLKLYGLFKQATNGPVTSDSKAPGMFDMVGKAKFGAWKDLGGLNKEDAMRQYAALVNELAGSEDPVPAATGGEAPAAGAARVRPTLESIARPRRTFSFADSASLKTIKSELAANGVLTVTLNRPNRGNAFNLDMWNDLRTVFETINQDAAVRVVILTGNEKAFSTGMDLGVFQDMDALAKKEPCPGRVREALVHVIQWLQDSISGPEKCVVPVLAVINGHCIGGAVDLATACDLRYCTDDAVFSIKETDLAMVADIGTLQRLPKLVGDMQSRELAYTGRDFTGKEAEKMGLVLKSFSTNADMQLAVKKTADIIASKSPLTVRGIKSTILFTRDHSVQESLHQIKMHNSAMLYSSDLMEAMRATLMKDKPSFKAD